MAALHHRAVHPILRSGFGLDLANDLLHAGHEGPDQAGHREQVVRVLRLRQARRPDDGEVLRGRRPRVRRKVARPAGLERDGVPGGRHAEADQPGRARHCAEELELRQQRWDPGAGLREVYLGELDGGQAPGLRAAVRQRELERLPRPLRGRQHRPPGAPRLHRVPALPRRAQPHGHGPRRLGVLPREGGLQHHQDHRRVPRGDPVRAAPHAGLPRGQVRAAH
mmetsp:Transcript_102239/g.329657  ORF Transcript_102239/g.329657 Transcript_102239/m.329657 type:complete len:223 (+) Transcript_102239:339-1007(+)